MLAYRQSNRIGARLVRFVGDCLARRKASAGRLCIVNYHRILEEVDPLAAGELDVNAFRWQMRLLADCFNVMPLSAALEAMATNRLPPRAVCITFDDGYRSTHDLALPILKQFDLPATVFVTTGFIGEGNMWNDTIREAVRILPGDMLDLSEQKWGVFALGTPEQRKDAVVRLTEIAKYLPPPDRLALTSELARRASGQPEPGLMLTPEMIRALERDRVEIGGHTVSHPILTRLDDDVARFEIEECKRQLDAICSRPVRYFAYPNGKFGIDFDARHMTLAREAGFSAAFTTAIGAATGAHDRYRLPRSLPWDTTRSMYAVRLLRWLAN
jgi:peptidoglycan/xylan/chitin deacetylase (PgdA/CDA1 family)